MNSKLKMSKALLRIIPDPLLTLPIFLLLSLSVLVIYSSDPRAALTQFIVAAFGLVAYWFLSLMDFESLRRYVRFLYPFVLLSLLVVFVLGIETRGSLRWIQIAGFQIQPSEIAKPVMILFLADYWSKNLPSWINIGKSLLWILPVLALIFKQPDLGTALTIFMIWLVMLIGANISLAKLSVMGLSFGLFLPVVWFLLKDYQKARIATFLSPAEDPLGVGYNVIQSVIAVGSGQLLGRGLGRGTQSRLQFLPEFRTDFIFASIAEELGFIGSVIVLILYGLLLGHSFRIAARTGSKFGSLLILGVLGMLFFQIVVNIGMNTGVVPVTGITLPLLSYGGSSIISTLISLGFIASVARFGRRDLAFLD